MQCRPAAPQGWTGHVLLLAGYLYGPRQLCVLFQHRDALAVSVKYYHARGWNKVALISPTDATGQDGEKSIDLALATPGGTGMTVVAREHFNLTDISVAAQMARIKASGAQAIFAWVSGTAFGTVMRGVTDAGIDLPIVTSTANLTYPQLEAEAAVMNDNVLFPAGLGPSSIIMVRWNKAKDTWVSVSNPGGQPLK